MSATKLKSSMKKRKHTTGSSSKPAVSPLETQDYGVLVSQHQFRKDQYTAESFVSDLLVDLFEDLEKKPAASGSAATSSFNPAPFAAVFESAAEQVRELRDDVDDDVARLVDETKDAEEEHKLLLGQLNATLQGVFGSFRELDTRISRCSHTAVRIGDRLKTVDAQTEQCKHGRRLISYFLQFNSGSVDPIFNVPRTLGGHREQLLREAASLIQQLKPVSDLKIAGTDTASETVNRKAEEIETALLDAFQDAAGAGGAGMGVGGGIGGGIGGGLGGGKLASSSGNDDHHHHHRGGPDTDRMRALAETLLKFERDNVRRQYVSRVNLELKTTIEQRLGLSSTVANAGLPASSPLRDVDQVDAALASMFDDVLSTVAEQLPVVERVFPDPEKVTQQLLERVFEELVRGFLVNVMEMPGRGAGERLQILEMTYRRAQALVEDIKARLQKLPSNESGVLTLGVDDILEAVFADFRRDYLEEETRLLREFLTRTSVEKQLEFGNEAAAQSSPSGAGGDGGGGGSSSGAQGASGAQGGGGSDRWRFRKGKTVEPHEATYWSLRLLRSEFIEECIRASQASLARCALLSEPARVGENLRGVFSVFLQTLSSQLLLPILDDALSMCPATEPKKEPSLFFFVVANQVNAAAKAIEAHFAKDVQPVLSSNRLGGGESHNALLICTQEKDAVLSSYEDKLTEGLSTVLTSVLHWISSVLHSEQKKSDFKPKESSSDDVFALTPSAECSKACARVTEFVARASLSVETYMRGGNLDAFVTHLGVGLFNAVLAHLAKFTISTRGATLLMGDCRKYARVLGDFHDVEVQERFDLLQQLAVMFSCQPDALKQYIRDTRLGELANDELRAFLKLRADWKVAKHQVFPAQASY